MSPVVRKSAFCICENKDADQLGGNRTAHQRLCFRYLVQSLYFLNPKFQASDCPLWFLSGPVGNPEDKFSSDAAHLSEMGKGTANSEAV